MGQLQRPPNCLDGFHVTWKKETNSQQPPAKFQARRKKKHEIEVDNLLKWGPLLISLKPLIEKVLRLLITWATI